MIKVRKGTMGDLPRALELIKELAAYEHALDEVTNNVDRMKLDGFGTHPCFGFFIAARENQIVGLAIYYYRYSTWKGKRLYLEDIVVTEAERGKGVGQLLFEEVMKKAVEDKCTGMMWQVLEWNEPALKFYGRYDAKLDAEWINCSLEASQIARLLTK
jgi:GNAT superfamily N-acetyltransferase